MRERCHSECENYKSLENKPRSQKAQFIKKLLEDLIKDGFKFFDENGNLMDPSNNKGHAKQIKTKIRKIISDKIIPTISVNLKRKASDELDVHSSKPVGDSSKRASEAKSSQQVLDSFDVDLEDNYSCFDSGRYAALVNVDQCTKTNISSDKNSTFVQRLTDRRDTDSKSAGRGSGRG